MRNSIKNILILVISISSLSFIGKDKTSQVVEMVVYHIKPEEVRNKELIVTFINKEMKTFPGFISRNVYQSSNDSTLFTDIVQWRSKEDAESAAKMVQQSQSCSKFFSVISKVVLFDHFNSVE